MRDAADARKDAAAASAGNAPRHIIGADVRARARVCVRVSNFYGRRSVGDTTKNACEPLSHVHAKVANGGNEFFALSHERRNCAQSALVRARARLTLPIISKVCERTFFRLTLINVQSDENGGHPIGVCCALDACCRRTK